MEWKDLFIDSYEEAFNSIERALDGLSQEDLDLQSHPDCNSIGWTTGIKLENWTASSALSRERNNFGLRTDGMKSSTAHPTLQIVGQATAQSR